MRITVDPSAKASGFGYAETGEYKLRVIKVEQRQKDGGEFPYLNWELAFADPNIKATDGESEVGHIFEITTLKPSGNAQFRLRQVCDALGLTWGDFDTDDVVGLELTAKVKVKQYNGKLSNEVDTFVSIV